MTIFRSKVESSSEHNGNIAYQQCDRRAERSRGRIPGRGVGDPVAGDAIAQARCQRNLSGCLRSEEHTSELQSLMRISYAVFCLKKKKMTKINHNIKININQTRDNNNKQYEHKSR